MNKIETKYPDIQKAPTRTLKGDMLNVINKYPRATAALAGAAVALSAVAAGSAVGERFSAPDFSSETSVVNVEDGDGLQSITDHIDGIETIDWRDAADYIENLPQNEAALQDGLQPGESITIPTSVGQ